MYGYGRITMMNLAKLNDKIRTLQHEIEGNKVLIDRLHSAKKSLKEREDEKKHIEQRLKKEEKDVAMLKGLSFANLWHTLVNNKTERMHEEEKDVLKVKQELDRIDAEIIAEQEEIQRVEGQVQSLVQLEDGYKALIQEKKTALENSGSDVWEKIEMIEHQVEEILHQIKELGEALHEGEKALSQSDDILSSLQSAANWGTYDMFGGGMLATMAKRSHMDEAQKKIYTFQNTLRRYNQELQDVGEAYLEAFSHDGFLRFADWFFDGFFVDWTVQSEINQAKDQVSQTKQAISNLQQQLNQQFQECEKKMERLLREEEALVVNAEE